MAFHFFLSLLPLLVFIGFVASHFVKAKGGAEVVLSPLLATLPATASVVVQKELERLAGASTLAPLAAVGFLWLASGGMHGLMNALETVVGAPRRPWWKKRVLSLGWVLLSLATLVVASWGLIEWDSIVQALEEEPTTSVSPSTMEDEGATAPLVPERPSSIAEATHTAERTAAAARRRGITVLRGGGERALALLLSIAGAIAALAAFYRLSVSHPRRVKRRVLPGAALAVVLWIVISWGFGLYVRTLAGYAVFYGSLTAVAVLLVWLWLTSLAILVGAELNSQLEGLRD
jgi:membrane protein